MPTTISNPGVFSSSAGGDFLDEFRKKSSLQVAERNGRDGEVAKVFPHRTMHELSFKGGGDPAMALGAGAVNGVSGGVTITSEYEITESNDKHSEFSAAAKNYPTAA